MAAEIDLGSVDAIRGWLVGWMANELNIEVAEVEPEKPFLGYGMDSMSAMMLVGDLEGLTGYKLPPTLAWDYPSVDALADHLVSRAGTSAPEPVATAARLVATANGKPDPRAILSQLDGMSEEDMDALLAQYLDSPH